MDFKQGISKSVVFYRTPLIAAEPEGALSRVLREQGLRALSISQDKIRLHRASFFEILRDRSSDTRVERGCFIGGELGSRKAVAAGFHRGYCLFG